VIHYNFTFFPANFTFSNHISILVISSSPFSIQVSCRYNSVKDAFVRWDADHDGVISDREFRNALKYMGVELTTSEYKKLWKRFDADGGGSIDYAEFNNKIGVLIHPKTDMILKRPETPKLKEWQKRSFARGLKKKVKDIESAFKAVDTDNSGYISAQEFYQLLKKLGMAKMNAEDMAYMMQRHRKPENDTGEMSYEEFTECIHEYMKIPSDVDNYEDGLKPMPLVEAEKIMAEKLFNKFDRVTKAFRLYDEDKSGELSYDEFRNMIKSMNVGLTNDHVVALIKRYDPDGDGSISYDEFCKMVGPLIHPDAINTSKSFTTMMEVSGAQDGLSHDPNKKMRHKPKEEEEVIGGTGSHSDPQPVSAEDKISAPVGVSSSSSSSSQSILAPIARAGASSGVSGVPPLRRAGSVATSQMDVNATEAKMRHVLGKSWVHVYKQVKGTESSAVSGDSFRDMMAERGVPLTSKEVRALSLKYSAGDGTLDAEKLLTSTFSGKNSAPKPPVARPGSAFASMKKTVSAPGATMTRPGTAAVASRSVF
jgi:Ca2+-binding EF-hand superfamily protein